MLHDQIRRRIREERKQQGYSAADFASQIGMDERSLRRLESGETKDIGVGQLELIAEKLGKRVQQLIPEAELLDHVQRKPEGAAELNTVISLRDAFSFFRGLYGDHINYLKNALDDQVRHNQAQSHIITALTGELEMLRGELKAPQMAYPTLRETAAPRSYGVAQRSPFR